MARERNKDAYLLHRDPIYRDRLHWQAHTFRHIVHLLPGETILEVGAGRGLFAAALAEVTRARNPITAWTFDPEAVPCGNDGSAIERISGPAPPEALSVRRFDYVVVQNILDDSYAAYLAAFIYDHLVPGGQMVLFESNPWNLYHVTKSFLRRLVGRPTGKNLLSQPELYQLISEIGFIRISVRFTDFVYPPLPKSLIWTFKNLSVILENTPVIRTLAGRILISAQKPPREVRKAPVSLARHDSLRDSVSVVVPCHNEEGNIEPLVEGLLSHYGDYIHRIILVDDNSTDGTRAVIDALAAREPRIRPIFREPPNGVGLALKEGYAAVDSEYVLSMDCDFQELLPELEDMFDSLARGHDAVQGSRFSPKSTLINYPFGKIVANRAFHLLFNILFRRHHRDLTNNLRIMRTQLVRRLDLRECSFACNAEIGLQLALSGASLEEIPVSWVNRTHGMGSSSFRVLQSGGGYARVLARLARETRFGSKPLPRVAARNKVIAE